MHQEVYSKTRVNLDGTQSHDPEGKIASYQWSQTNGPAVEIFDAHTARPYFISPDAREKCSFRLTVTDHEGLQDSDEVDVYVSRVLFRDDFTEGLNLTQWAVADDSAGTANRSLWTVNNGALHQLNYVASRIDGPALFQSYHQGTCLLLKSMTGLADFRLQVELTPLPNGPDRGTDGNDVGILLRYTDPNNYYRLSMNSRYGFTRLEKKVAGRFSTLAVNSIGYFNDIPMEIIAEANGTHIQILIDNQPLFSVDDTDLNRGMIGLYCQAKTRFENVLVTDARMAPRMMISQPLSYSLTECVGQSLLVKVHAAGLPSDSFMEFFLDHKPAGIIKQPPFNTQFNDVSVGNHCVEVVSKDKNGMIICTDRRDVVGVGGCYYIAVGDSIVNGEGDTYALDSLSKDGRIVGFQGIAARLSDLLTESRNLPHIVFNEGLPGETSSAALNDIDSILERHPMAEDLLLLLGTNDAAQSVEVDIYSNNIRALIEGLLRKNKRVRVAKIPPQFNPVTGLPDSSRNSRIEQYNQILTNLSGAQPGPDFYAYFSNHKGLFKDSFHPNSLGYRCMAHLWHNALTDSQDPPFVLQQLSTPAFYQQNIISSGNYVYIDENHTLQASPQELKNGIWIMPANRDAGSTKPGLISFYVDGRAAVYIGYDGAAATQIPNWLRDAYDRIEERIMTSAGTFNLYMRPVANEVVILDGNHYGGGTGRLNYLTIIVPQ
ncbi:MAG: GDSL-type esterase/lipase family protein [Candidatus Zixiibacteriota bacterium]